MILFMGRFFLYECHIIVVVTGDDRPEQPEYPNEGAVV